MTIPKINVSLPIFDQTTTKTIGKRRLSARGHLIPDRRQIDTCGTFQPPRLAASKIVYRFTSIKIEDHFYIEINGQYLAYQVDQIKTVAPTETEALQIQENQDLVTLVTCTPYMVNSHRLLVRGHRVAVEPEEIKESLEKKLKQAKRTAFYS